ncbi:MAG: hypothetical protein IKA87_06585 [Lentisphaeria bacterium]|nr:hypothetical protein [Lentisphaeria bacterium]
MSITFAPLLAEAEQPEFAPWRNLLRALALLHESSLYRVPGCKAPYPLETLGPGYYFSPAFSHWDLIYCLLDFCPVMPEHTLQQLENMLFFQQPDGSLPGAIFFRNGPLESPEPYWYSTFPAVWPMAADEYTRVTGTNKAIELCYEPLCRQISWYEANRKADGFGFFYTDTLEPKTWESGVDESPRCELFQERGKFPCCDATSHLWLLYDAAARWGTALGKGDKGYAAKRDELGVLLREKFFSDETGFFHDAYLLEHGIKFRTLNALWPFVFGIASKEQADRIIDGSLLDPSRFFTEHPLPYVAVDEPCFELRMWRGGAFTSATLMILLGCLKYGRQDAAVKIAERVMHYGEIYAKRTMAIWEFYHPFGQSPRSMGRKSSPWLMPCSQYVGHNPFFAVARILTQY